MHSTRFLIPVLLAFAIAGCGETERREAASGTPVTVRTAVLAEEGVPALITAMGSTVAGQTATLSSKLMSRVNDVTVHEGDPIRKGQVLVRLDSQDLSARRRQAEAAIRETRAALDNAALTLRRIQALYDQKAAPRRNLDDARTGHDRAQAAAQAAEAGLKELDATLDYGIVRAPFDGTVSRRMIEPGDMAAPGAPLLAVEDASRIKVVARAGEGEMDAVRVGSTAFVEVGDTDAKRIPCTVERVVRSADPASRTFEVETVLDNAEGRFRPGMFARLLIGSGTNRAILVPRAGLVIHGQLEGVYVVEGEVARLRWIRTGRDHGDRVEVLSGLSAGERVVVTNADRLKDGDRIAEGGR
jgi:RND family efflux transporter MFP subunit